MPFNDEGSGFHIAPRSTSNRIAARPPGHLVPWRLIAGTVVILNSIEVLPPKVSNARLQGARSTVGSVVRIRAEVEKIGEDVSMSGECRALKHAR